MKPFHVCGLGNAIVDIFLDVSDEDFAKLEFKRGTMELVDNEAQQSLLTQFHDGQHDLQLVSGGSVANSVIGLSQLGGKSAFIGCVGDDRYGMHYAEEFSQLNIEIGNPILVGETTGTCVAVITPDAERTMRTCLAVSSQLAAKHVDAQRIANSEWLFIEGYVFANPATGQLAIKEAIRIAKEHGTKIALTCSDAFIPQVFGDAFREALKDADLLFCNAPESVAITQAADTAEAFAKLKDMAPNSVVTDGPHGAFVRFAGTEAHVPAVECQPRDLTGAGDMFAGAFLYGITHGYTPEKAARGANYMCHKVITQVGARLHQGAQGYWQEALA
ncbi:adenosine kinase [Aureliella helgolandensis]|uniref:Ribokinase n=1 Tax=Aureliella helgolandensis TaxID=2527968 RepID=A0A518GG10_9BACT|nr:adenosine kinase [Aureliella helgolandensis]QDV27532.1 Ribokinase [Aureliella helgolandensis]